MKKNIFFSNNCVVGESLVINEDRKLPSLTKCQKCAYVSSQQICKACILLEGLNRGLPKLGIGKSSRIKKLMIENNRQNNCCNTNCNRSCTNLAKNNL